MNAAHLLSLVDNRNFRELFIAELGWNNPDQPAKEIEVEGNTYSLTQVAGFKGLRIWYCAELPPRKIQRVIDEQIGQGSHERLVIFAEPTRQEWRWPRRSQLGAANAKLLVHQHVVGNDDPHLGNQLKAIAIDFDTDISLVELLAKMRLAFDAEAEAASVQAARLMGRLYTELDIAGANERDATLLLARLLFLLFGDDSGMWSAGMFYEFINNQTTAENLNKQLHELFDVLNTDEGQRKLPADSPLGRFRYINGGLFTDGLAIVELTDGFRNALISACQFDWGIISPAVFGSMFQTVKSKDARRFGGEHYTSETNILKTIRPLFLEEYTRRLETGWDSQKELTKLHVDLGKLRFMDPACGCGNFLIVSYRELRALELELLKRQRDLDIEEGRTTIASRGQQSFDVTGDIKVTLDHFYGIEIEEWPARIAETAMLLVDHLANLRMEQDFGLAPDRLPIRIAPTIVHADALKTDWSAVLPVSDSTYIFGNPPFVGISLRSDEQTQTLKEVWGAGYHGTLDFVSGWYKKAIDYVGNSKARVALVSTNSICQGEQVAPLWGAVIKAGFGIDFAHKTFAWTTEAPGGAAVHVVIVGISKVSRRVPVLYEYQNIFGPAVGREVANISPYLIEGPSVVVEPLTAPLAVDLPDIFYGNKPTDDGNLIVEIEDLQEVLHDLVAAKYLRRYVGARELLHGADRWCLWLVDLVPGDLEKSPTLRERVKKVEEFRGASKAASTRVFASSPQLFRQIAQPTTDYVSIPIHVSESRRFFPVLHVDKSVISSNANFVAPDPTGLAFGILSSSMFIAWLKAVGGRIKSDLRLNKLGVWNTLPLPALSAAQISAVVDAGTEIKRAREQFPDRSLADLYEPTAIPSALISAHADLDRVVDPLFAGTRQIGDDDDRLRILFERYTALTTANQLQISPALKRRRQR
ncbi:DNA methyltransferase [Cryobacterium sp. W22_MBD10_FK3]|uniref:DNA methyltransferase n=1 Tax=Cryobacterium sp. W22_MBD10_FK3 TaxID=3240273 RepID=UPI003F8E4EA7